MKKISIVITVLALIWFSCTYTSYDGMKGAFEGKMSKRVIDDQNTALSMPTPESDTLTSEEFVLFSCWIQQEFPEN